MRRLGSALALTGVTGLAALAGAGLWAPGAARAAPAGIAPIPRGVVDVFATVPSPGYPALPLVWGGDIFEGTYTALSGSSVHSHVVKYDSTGQLLANFTVADQPTEPYGVQVAYFDDDLIIANQSFLVGNTPHMALLALGTGELGQRVYIPADAGPAAPVKKKPVKKTTPTKATNTMNPGTIMRVTPTG